MKRKFLLFATALMAGLVYHAKAQIDTAHYDLGHVKLQKKFTQAVTIKGTDLEKIPFSNLNDAVKAWLYGVYGGDATIVTIIDGNLNDDINAYSIYDIDEITLIQNSVANVNGIAPSQLLLLVKTRRSHPGKSGITAAGQTNLVKARNTSGVTPSKSTTNYYSQYYLSAYTNTGKLQAGASADFQHYVVPIIQTANIFAATPPNFNRFKFNAYLDTKLNDNNTLSVNAGYAPQTNNAAFGYSFNSGPSVMAENLSLHSYQNLFHGDVKLNSRISSRLNNTFSTGLQHYQSAGTGDYDITQQSIRYHAISDSSANITAYLIKDDLSYEIKAGKWSIEPNLNFSYHHIKDSTINQFNLTGSGVSSSNQSFIQKFTLLTPSVAFTYGDAVSVQGGVQIILDKWANIGSNKPTKIYPFATVTANLLPAEKAGDAQLSIFTSYASSIPAMGVYTAKLSDFELDGVNFNYLAPIPATNSYIPAGYNPYKVYGQYQAGARLVLKDSLTLSYNYNVQQFLAPYTLYAPGPNGVIVTVTQYPQARLNIHRLGINMNVVHNSNFSWASGLNASILRYNLTFVNSSTAGFTPNNQIFTGGFVNRFNYKKFTAGLDAIYRLNEDINSGLVTPSDHSNSFDIANLYAGYRLKHVEVFANAQNLAENKKSTISNNQRFYGLGFNLTL